MLINKIVPKIFDLCNIDQTASGTTKVPMGTFTERWFRDSGLYDLHNPDNIKTTEIISAVLRNAAKGKYFR